MKLLKQLRPFALIMAIISVFVLGMIGCYDTLVIANNETEWYFWKSLYAIISMFLMEANVPNDLSNPYLLMASYIAALILGYGFFMAVYKYAYEGWMLFRIRYFYDRHIMILGVGSIGFGLAEELLNAGYQVVAIESDENHENVAKIRQLGGLVLTESAYERATLVNAGLSKAKYCIIALGKDDNNLRSVNLISHLNYLGVIQKSIKVLVHIRGRYNTGFLRDYMDLYNKTEKFDIDTFNTDRLAAQVIFDKYSPLYHISYKTQEDQTGNVIDIESNENHIVIVGYNTTTEAFIAENIILSHSPGIRNLRIVLIEKNIKKVLQALHFKYPFMDDYIDVIPVELENENFYGALYQSKQFHYYLKNLSGVYFFGEDDAYLMGLANAFRQVLYSEIGDLTRTPMVICLPENSQVLDLLDPKEIHSHGANAPLFNELREKFNTHVIKLIADNCTKHRLIDASGITDALAKTVNYFYSMKYEFEWLLTDEERQKFTPEILELMEKRFLETKFSTKNPLQELEKAVLSEFSKGIGKPMEELTNFSIENRWNSLEDLKQESNRYVARHLKVKVDFLKKMQHNNLERETIEKYFKVFAPIEHKRWCAEKMVFRFRFGDFPPDNKTKKLLKDRLKIHDQLIDYEILTKEMEDKDFNMFLLITVMQGIKDCLEI